jgi:hypothetical protein
METTERKKPGDQKTDECECGKLCLLVASARRTPPCPRTAAQKRLMQRICQPPTFAGFLSEGVRFIRKEGIVRIEYHQLS